MSGWANKLFYTASAIVLGSAFFVLQPTHNADAAKFKQETKHEFSTAYLQVIGDQPMFESVGLVVSSINSFYEQSADAVIAMLEPAPSENDMLAVAGIVVHDFAMATHPHANFEPAAQTSSVAEVYNEPSPLADFMSEEPIYNIVPAKTLAQSTQSTEPQVASATIENASNDSSVITSSHDVWVNLEDGTTGAVYCVAIFNAEVNRYLGPCKHDYH